MASCENNDTSLVEIMDLEAIEIDENLLRELLEEQEGKDHDNDYGMVESQQSNVSPNMMDEEQEKQQQHNCLEQHEFHSVHEFEWLNTIEPINPPNDVIMNWFSDGIVGTVDFDFGYANGECYSQICDGFFSNDASYGYLWEDYII